mmetsp:Transcript_20851/g.52957  ORF Transcript_20851/g.52957 Transcript_20851/m.52957 type:complete len:214 (+) Transcript_20851:949-1590(+)
MSVAMLSAIFAASLAAIPGRRPALLFTAQLFLQASLAVATICSGIASEVAPRGRTGEAVGLVTTALSITAGIGPLAFGTVIEAFSRSAFPGGAFLLLAGQMGIGLVLSRYLPGNDVLTGLQASDGGHLDQSMQPLPHGGNEAACSPEPAAPANSNHKQDISRELIGAGVGLDSSPASKQVSEYRLESEDQQGAARLLSCRGPSAAVTAERARW